MVTNAVSKGLVVGITILLIGVVSATNINVKHIENLKTEMRAGFQPSEVWIDDDFNESTLGWNVTHFDTIQKGVDNASDEGIVYVWNGTYYENVIVNKKLDLIGNGTVGSQNTIIDGRDKGNVVSISASGASISYFTIRNSMEAGIEVELCNKVMVKGCNISASQWGISIDRSDNCSIIDNKISDNSYGIYISRSHFTAVEKNIIRDNSFGLLLDDTRRSQIKKNDIILNAFGIAISISFFDVINYNNIVGNYIIGVTAVASITFAQSNFWGAITGPSFRALGWGDTIFWFVGRIFYFLWSFTPIEDSITS